MHKYLSYYTAALILVADIVHGAAWFDGTSAIMQRDHFSGQGVPFSPQQKITIAFWIKRVNTNYAGLISKNSLQGGAEGNHQISINNTKTNRLEFGYQASSDASSQVYSTAPNAVSVTNVWIHIAFSYDYLTASSATFYVNGAPLSGGWTTGTGGVAPTTTVNSEEKFATDGSHFVLGEITEPCFYYNQALNNREIALLYSRVKYLPLQLRTTQGDGFSGFGTCVYWPYNNGPTFTTASSITNSAIDMSHYFRPATPLNSPQWRAEQVCSYPPNE